MASPVNPSSGARQIVGAMTVTMLFAVINQYVDPKKTPDPFKIFLGGFAATAILVGMTEAGEGAAELGVGLAYLTVMAATLVYGGPVWKVLSTKLGVKTAPTKPTAPTTPTPNGFVAA
jgi:hypothetical protein